MAKIEYHDVFATLCYLQANTYNDTLMFSKFTTITNGRLENLFWSNDVSRFDYHCFGDVAFDTMNKKNKYNKSLVFVVVVITIMEKL